MYSWAQEFILKSGVSARHESEFDSTFIELGDSYHAISPSQYAAALCLPRLYSWISAMEPRISSSGPVESLIHCVLRTHMSSISVTPFDHRFDEPLAATGVYSIGATLGEADVQQERVGENSEGSRG